MNHQPESTIHATEHKQPPGHDHDRHWEPQWDQLSIDTPELVGIDMPVAGLGSRFVALMVDYLIWLAVLIVLVVVIALVDPSLSHFSKIGQKWANAIFIAIPFLFLWGYFTLFEAFWNGRTPGKRIARIRVIQISGRGIGLFESMTRNLVRFVDQFPGIYVVGAISIFLSSQHQRLGDMAAGTLVVHERENLRASAWESSGRTFTAGMFPTPLVVAEKQVASPAFSSSNIHKLDSHDLEVLEAFFARRLDFTLTVRQSLARRIAEKISVKAGIPLPPEGNVEAFLEEIARTLRDLSRMG